MSNMLKGGKALVPIVAGTASALNTSTPVSAKRSPTLSDMLVR